MKTEVKRVFKVGNDSVCGDTPIVRAYADVEFDGVFTVKGFQVVDKKGELSMGLPYEVNKDGKWYHYIQFSSPELLQDIEESILKAYNG